MANVSTLTVNGVAYTLADAEARAAQGELSALQTQDRSSLVAAINEAAAPMTQQEKDEIVAQVLSALPDGDEVAY